MAEATPGQLADALVERLRTELGTENVIYGPPESVPAALMYWVRYGPVAYEWGMFTVPHPGLSITVAVPRKGNYPSEYRLITDEAQRVVHALMGQFFLADEAPITGVSVGEASGMNYAGVTDALMAAVITIEIENKEINA